MERDYNTTRPGMIIKEYGRNVQNLVHYALSLEDKDKRTKLAHIIVSVMQQVNPSNNINEEYLKKLWNHLYIISDYKLDIDFPYEVHKPDQLEKSPVHLDYKDNNIEYRFYGRNTELVLRDLAKKEEGPERDELVIIMANQMKTMYVNWNKCIVGDDLIDAHIRKLTDNKISLPAGIELISANSLLKKVMDNTPSTKSTARAKKITPKKQNNKDKKTYKRKRQN